MPPLTHAAELMRFEAPKARVLLERASQIVPRGSKPLVILEQSRLEEFEGRQEASVPSIVAAGL